MASKEELLRNVSTLEVDLQSLKAEIKDMSGSDVTLFGVDINTQIKEAQSLIEEILYDR